MSPGRFIEEMASYGIETFILDDIREGRDSVDVDFLLDVIKHLPSKGKVFVGIEDINEIRELTGTDVNGVIISCSKLMEGISWPRT
jgi:hypothetical protein